MKKFIKIFAGLLTLGLVISCGSKDENTNTKSNAKEVAIVYSTGGKGDKSFNDSAFRGLEKAKKDFGIKFSEYEPKDPSAEARNQLANYAQTGKYDLIIGVGFTMKDALLSVANDYPDQKFAIIDEVIDNKKNVTSIMFKEQEGSFLIGALAAMMSKTGTIGFVGGIPAPVIYRFESGFVQGAKYINPKIKIISVYIGGGSAFNDPVAAKQLTEQIVSQGADIVFHAAGASGAGVFQAAKEKGVYAIGVDSNQDDVEKGVILTSMVKNVDNAVYQIIDNVLNNKFESGVKYFGIKENGVGTTDFKYTKDKIGKTKLDKIQELKSKIENGKIKVTQYLPQHNQK